MKKTVLLLIGLTMVILSYGQTIKIQAGTSISKLDWQLKGVTIGSIYDETLIGYSIFAGVDYLDKRYFNLSSNIGMIRKGGKGEFMLTDQYGQSTGQTITEKPTLDYLSINTTFDLKYRIKETVTPFISFGPRIDFLVRSSRHFDALEEIKELKNIAIGFIVGVGLKYDISNLQFGLRADYYYDFTNIADWKIENTGNVGKVEVNTFTINFTIGYKIK